MMARHRMLFAAYHYSLSGMPPSKTVEFLCRSCEAILRPNTLVPVSKVGRQQHFPTLTNPILPFPN